MEGEYISIIMAGILDGTLKTGREHLYIHRDGQIRKSAEAVIQIMFREKALDEYTAISGQSIISRCWHGTSHEVYMILKHSDLVRRVTWVTNPFANNEFYLNTENKVVQQEIKKLKARHYGK